MTAKLPTVESFRQQRESGNDNGTFWVDRHYSLPDERDIPTWSVAFHCDEFDNGERYYHAYLERWTDTPRYPFSDAVHWNEFENILSEEPSKEAAIRESVAWLEGRSRAYASVAASFRATFPHCFDAEVKA